MEAATASRTVLDWLALATAQAALIACIVLLATTLLRRRLTPAARCALWSLVLLRLALPVVPQSQWSLWNIAPARHPSATPTTSAIPRPETNAIGGWTIEHGPLGGLDAAAPSPSAVAPSPAPGRFSPSLLLVVLWLAGAAVFLAAMAHSNFRLFCRLRNAAPISDPAVLTLLSDCRRRMKIATSPALVEIDTHGPALAGLLRPRILLPAGLARRLTPDQLRFVFLHELAHLKRRDILLDYLLAFVHALHWFNPVAWLALARFRSERELSRDAMVLNLTAPPQRAEYGRTILRIVEDISVSPLRLGAVGLLEERGQLRRRISTIARHGPRPRAALPLTVLLALAIACAAFTQVPAPRPASQSGNPQTTAAPPAEHAREATPDVSALVRRAREFTSVGKYVDALHVIDQIQKLDPSNEYANGVRALVEDHAALQQVRVVIDPRTGVQPNGLPLYDRLDRRLPEVRFEAVAFEDVIDFLRDVTGANIVVDWRSLEAAGITGKIPVTQRLRDVKFNQALELILRDVAPPAAGRPFLQFIVSQGAIVISTAEQILIEARFIQVGREALKDDAIRHRLFPIMVAAAPRMLSQQEADELFRLIQTHADTTTLSAPRLLVFNSQAGTLRIGEDRPHVTGFGPRKPDGSREPVISTLATGISLDVHPTLSVDRKTITTRLNSKVTHLSAMTDLPWPDAAPDEKLTIQSPRLNIQELQATVYVSENKTVAAVLPRTAGQGVEPETMTILLLKPSLLTPPNPPGPQVPPEQR